MNETFLNCRIVNDLAAVPLKTNALTDRRGGGSLSMDHRPETAEQEEGEP